MNSKMSDPAGDVLASAEHKFGIALAGLSPQIRNRAGEVEQKCKRRDHYGTHSVGNARTSPSSRLQFGHIATRRRDLARQYGIEAWETPARKSAT